MLYIRDKHGHLLQIRGTFRTRLEKSPQIKQWMHETRKNRDDEENTLDIPFTFHELHMALDGHTYDFETWNGIVGCASYLGLRISPETVRVAQLFTIECIRASGINPAHFSEASLFSHVLSSHDSRFHPVDVKTLESLYWGAVVSNTNLEAFFKEHMEHEVYDAAVNETRSLRERMSNPPLSRMTAVM